MTAGIAFGIWFAPEVGSATWNKLSATLTSFGDAISTTVADQIDKLTDVVKARVSKMAKAQFGGAVEAYPDNREHAWGLRRL